MIPIFHGSVPQIFVVLPSWSYALRKKIRNTEGFPTRLLPISHSRSPSGLAVLIYFSAFQKSKAETHRAGPADGPTPSRGRRSRPRRHAAARPQCATGATTAGLLTAPASARAGCPPWRPLAIGPCSYSGPRPWPAVGGQQGGGGVSVRARVALRRWGGRRGCRVLHGGR